MHKLQRIQRIPVSRREAWEFFSSPKNLKDITPSYLGFDIISELPEKIYPGMIISYRIKPLLGIPVKWVTEISHVKEEELFVDNQLSGPYKLWHHQHHFSDIPGGTEMKDILHYSLPLGLAGKIIRQTFIKNRLEEIFDYRYKILQEKFGSI